MYFAGLSDFIHFNGHHHPHLTGYSATTLQQRLRFLARERKKTFRARFFSVSAVLLGVNNVYFTTTTTREYGLDYEPIVLTSRDFISWKEGKNEDRWGSCCGITWQSEKKYKFKSWSRSRIRERMKKKCILACIYNEHVHNLPREETFPFFFSSESNQGVVQMTVVTIK